MIVTKFRNFWYNRLQMGLFALGDICQAKLDKLLSDIEGVTNYIDDILVLTKERFYKQIYQLIFIFAGMCSTGLKSNAPKYSFGLKGIPYPGYVTTW